MGILAKLFGTGHRGGSFEDHLRQAAECLEQRQYGKALKHANRAVASGSESARAYLTRGSVLARLEDYEKAIADYARAVELEPRWWRPYYARGTALSRVDRHEEAVRDLTEAIHRHEAGSDPYTTIFDLRLARGIGQFKLGTYEAADEDFQFILDQVPSSPSATTWHKACLNQIRKREEERR